MTVIALEAYRHRRTAAAGACLPHNADYGAPATAGSSATSLTESAPTGMHVVVAADYLTGYRGNTHQAYRRDLEDFFAYCEGRGLDPMQASRADLVGYLDELTEARASTSTLARRLVSLRGFYRLAVDEYGLALSPATRLRGPRRTSQTRLPALSGTELVRLLAISEQHSARAAGLTWLLATTGLRISEAISIRCE